MADIRCRQCGEPWDAYGVQHGDMTYREAHRFLRGEGCPCCEFGQKVPEGADFTEDFLYSLMDATDGDEVEDALDALL